jgi:hypothetical protein
MKLSINVTTTYNISLDTIADVLETAFFGGSNYWYMIEEVIPAPSIEYIPEYREAGDMITQFINGGSAIITDVETGEELGTLNASSMRKALHEMGRLYPKHIHDIIHEEYDADAADIFLQLAVMGKVVYG